MAGGSTWTATTFTRPALIQWNNNSLSDHNRSELDIDPNRIRNDMRTATGALRRYHIADKREFNWSWEMLPEDDSDTVDGFWGADSIIGFFNSTTGTFTLSLINEDNTETDYTVLFDDFSYTVVKRWDTYWYDIDVKLVEV
jgi:hypothetical protein